MAEFVGLVEVANQSTPGKNYLDRWHLSPLNLPSLIRRILLRIHNADLPFQSIEVSSLHTLFPLPPAALPPTLIPSPFPLPSSHLPLLQF
jgi:hypothetical protein